MSVNNRIGIKIEAAKLDPETTIKSKIYEITSDHMNNIDSLDMKIAAIKSNNKSSYSEYLSTNINICTT